MIKRYPVSSRELRYEGHPADKDIAGIAQAPADGHHLGKEHRAKRQNPLAHFVDIAIPQIGHLPLAHPFQNFPGRKAAGHLGKSSAGSITFPTSRLTARAAFAIHMGNDMA